VHQADVAERGGDAARQVELAGLDHRPADVQHQVDGEVALLVEEPQEQASEPLVGLPVDVPEVVAGRVGPMVREFQAAAAVRGQPVRAIVSGERPLGDDVQVLELLEELVVESEGHGWLRFVQPAETCASSSSTIVSVTTSSASPSKFSRMR
jgi:hypothetical protein